ncbi:MAG: helix-turn-helix domain-containing protein [Candidatus Aenigmarchaeota archaeon]|nr:helix-turn-helix domain-containing protein [Candidatus Aenigmarchaeota archaeon]
MFDKTILMNKIINTLHENEFETFVTHGSFDIVARREHLFLIKTLMNVDALDESHATDLQTISYFLSAYPFVISQRNNREHLNDAVVYSRFELPVMTPQLFKTMLEDEDIIVTYSSKGRHTQEINTFSLREKRKELDLTLEELAQQAGISKKAMYEIEKRRVNPKKETVRKLERILSAELSLPYEMKHTQAVYRNPRNHFQKSVSMEFSRIGIDNSSVHSSPFEIVGKESFSLITSLSIVPSEAKNELNEIKQLSNIFSSKSVLISKRSYKESVEGVPIISEQELNQIKDSKELSKIIDERI